MYIGIFFSIFYLFYYLYNKINSKYIVISKYNNTLKLHSNAVALYKAKNIKYNLIKQYHSQTLNKFPIYKDVLIIKFNQYL
jgi:hypothetical protein